MSVLGIDIGGTNLRVGLVQNNNLVRVEQTLIRKDRDEIISDLKTLIEKFNLYEIKGIGIGVPSLVDSKNGIVYDVQNIPSWKEVYLKRELEDAYNIPVYLNNDANCFAVGEKYFGHGKKYSSIVGLIIGTGLGAGIIINNTLYDGFNCGAGEFGMIPFKVNNYEYYCSGQFFKKVYGISGEEASLLAAAGDREALEIFYQFGLNIGSAISTIMYSVDPELIVLGGSVSKSYKYFEKSMWEVLNVFPYRTSATNLKIEISKVNHIAILGAAALYQDAMNSTSLNKADVA